MDEGRKADLKFIESKLKDPSLARDKRQELEHSRAMIAKQLRNPRITELRNAMNKATQAGDVKALEVIRGQLEQIDKFEHYDKSARI